MNNAIKRLSAQDLESYDLELMQVYKNTSEWTKFHLIYILLLQTFGRKLAGTNR